MIVPSVHEVWKTTGVVELQCGRSLLDTRADMKAGMHTFKPNTTLAANFTFTIAAIFESDDPVRDNNRFTEVERESVMRQKAKKAGNAGLNLRVFITSIAASTSSKKYGSLNSVDDDVDGNIGNSSDESSKKSGDSNTSSSNIHCGLIAFDVEKMIRMIDSGIPHKKDRAHSGLCGLCIGRRGTDHHAEWKTEMKLGGIKLFRFKLPGARAKSPDYGISHHTIGDNSLLNELYDNVEKRTDGPDKRLLGLDQHDDDILDKQYRFHSIQEYERLGNISEGNWGYLCRAVYKKTGTLHALKAINKASLCPTVPGITNHHKANKEQMRYEREFFLLIKINHPNIIKLQSFWQDDRRFYAVLPFMAGGSLYDRIVMQQEYLEKIQEEGEDPGHENKNGSAGGKGDSHGVLSGNYIAKYMRDIFRAISYCHQNELVLRTLRPECLLFFSGRDHTCKLADLKDAVILKPGEHLQERIGAPYYVAPEMLSQFYGKEVDLWAAGVILYLMVALYPPFTAPTNDEIFSLIKRGTYHLDMRTWKKDNMNPGAEQLVRRLLVLSPGHRIKVGECLQNEWVFRQKRELDLMKKLGTHKMIESRLRAWCSFGSLRQAAAHMIATQLVDQSHLFKIPKLAEIFQSMDTSHSGTLTLEEACSGFRKMGIDPPDLEELVRSLDRSGEGLIDWSETLTAMLETSVYQSDAYLWEVFTSFDKDRDGFLNKSDLEAVLLHDGFNKFLVGQKADEVLAEAEEYFVPINILETQHAMDQVRTTGDHYDKDQGIDYQSFCLLMLGEKLHVDQDCAEEIKYHLAQKLKAAPGSFGSYQEAVNIDSILRDSTSLPEYDKEIMYGGGAIEIDFPAALRKAEAIADEVKRNSKMNPKDVVVKFQLPGRIGSTEDLKGGANLVVLDDYFAEENKSARKHDEKVIHDYSYDNVVQRDNLNLQEANYFGIHEDHPKHPAKIAEPELHEYQADWEVQNDIDGPGADSNIYIDGPWKSDYHCELTGIVVSNNNLPKQATAEVNSSKIPPAHPSNSLYKKAESYHLEHTVEKVELHDDSVDMSGGTMNAMSGAKNLKGNPKSKGGKKNTGKDLGKGYQSKGPFHTNKGQDPNITPEMRVSHAQLMQNIKSVHIRERKRTSVMSAENPIKAKIPGFEKGYIAIGGIKQRPSQSSLH